MHEALVKKHLTSLYSPFSLSLCTFSDDQNINFTSRDTRYYSEKIHYCMPYMIEKDVLMSFYDILMLYNNLIDQKHRWIGKRDLLYMCAQTAFGRLRYRPAAKVL